ncbi:MAG: polyprenyl synthetase family protein [Deltaproteobacteria bacterium]|nr:polyprenyl synthetase family protein [Deltaproteobacteria bacterium]
MPDLLDATRIVAESIAGLLGPEASATPGMFSLPGQPGLSERTVDEIDRQVVQPVRMIAGRGGKGWRASVMLAACDAMGGDSEVLHPWVGVFELLHVGSLIVDDVQDGSTLRRGGPCCHEVYDEAVAINAGTSAYFLVDRMVDGLDVSPQAKLAIYRVFFRCVRAAHAGQGMDLAGLLPEATRAVARGTTASLLDSVVAIHQLKTGYPVVLCMLVGAIVAGADVQRRGVLTRYGLAMGVAFQIGDDILNLTGFASGLKTLGEDIAAGKITFPIAMALHHLDAEGRDDLLTRMRARQDTQENREAVQALLVRSDAIARSQRFATRLLEDAWAPLAQLLPRSAARDRLESYGPLFLHRHY